MVERTEIITNCLAGKTLSPRQTEVDGIVSYRCGVSFVSVYEHGCSVNSAGKPDNLCNQ